MKDKMYSILALMKNAEKLNVDTDFLLACMSVVQEFTQKSVDAVINDFSILLSRIDCILSGKKMDEKGNDISKVEEICKEYHVYMRMDDGTPYSFALLLRYLYNQWNHINCIEKTKIIYNIGDLSIETLMVLMNNYKTVLETEDKMQFAGEMFDSMYQHNTTLFNRIINVTLDDHSRHECAALIGRTLGEVMDAIIETNKPCSIEKTNGTDNNHTQMNNGGNIMNKNYKDFENTMNSIGISIKDRTFGEVMKEVCSKWNTLTENQQTVIANCFSLVHSEKNSGGTVGFSDVVA